MKTVIKLSCVVAFSMGIGTAHACEKSPLETEAQQMLAATAEQTKAEIRMATRHDLSQEWLLAPVDHQPTLTANTDSAEAIGDDDA